MTTIARRGQPRPGVRQVVAVHGRRLLSIANLQHPARLAVVVLTAALAFVGVGALLDDAQLPGWSLPGAVAIVVAYFAVISPLRRCVAAVIARWTAESKAHVWVRWFSHVLEVPAVLSRLAVPLAGLPIVLVLFAARGLSPWLQSCIGALAMLIAFLIVHAERPTLAHAKAWIGTRRGSRRSATAVVAAYIVLPLVALFAASRESHVVHLINSIGGFVTWVALFAVAVWLMAWILRLAAFAASPVRLFGFVPIGIATVRGAVAAGIVPGEKFAQRISMPGWFWIALFGAGILVMIVANPLHHRTARALPTWRHVATMVEALGFGAAALAAVFFFVAIFLAVDASRTYGQSVSSALGGPERPGMPGWKHLPASDQRLAEQFAPILELNRAERWPLSSVDGYLQTVALTGPGVNEQHVTEDSLPTSCHSATPTACFTLSCRTDAQPCDRGIPIGPGHGTRGVEYAHVLRATRREDAAAFIPPRPVAGKPIAAIVEYWLFYPYDRWQAGTAFGVLTQQHGADWEVVTVGLSDQGPVFVAYSAHCAGTWYRWDAAEARSGVLFTGDEPNVALHPLVAVALGSHANYVDAAAKRASDWSSCAHVSRKATAALTYTWNIRDRTSADYELRPAKVIVVKDGQEPTSFAGRWSASDRTTLENERTRTLAQGAGPTSPALKPLWTTPLWEIFRAGGWHQGSG
jgi:hypothetical protein